MDTATFLAPLRVSVEVDDLKLPLLVKVGFSSLHPDRVPPVARTKGLQVATTKRSGTKTWGKKASEGFSKLVVWTMFKL